MFQRTLSTVGLIVVFNIGYIFLAYGQSDSTNYPNNGGQYQRLLEEKINSYSDTSSVSLESTLLPVIDSAQVSGDYATAVYGLTVLLEDYFESSLQDRNRWDNRIQEIISNHQLEYFSQDRDSAIFYYYREAKSVVLYKDGKYTEAISLLKKVLNKTGAESIEDSLYITSWYSYLGSAYLSLENPDKAIGYYQKYIDHVPEGVAEYYGEDYLVFYHILGWSYLGGSWARKNKYLNKDEEIVYQKALACYHKALNLIETLKQPSNFANTILTTYSGLVRLQQHSQQFDSASYYLEKLGKYMDLPSKYTSEILFLKGKEAIKNNQSVVAINFFNQSIKLRTKLFGPAHFSLYQEYLAKAEVFRKTKNYDSAFLNVNTALSLLSKNSADVNSISSTDILFTTEAVEVLQFKAELLAQRAFSVKSKKQLEEALKLFELAINLSLTNRERFVRDDTKQQRIGQHRKLISTVLGLCINAKELLADEEINAMAFRFIEKGKGLLLAENFAEEQVLKKLNIDPDLMHEIDAVKTELNRLSTTLRSSDTQGLNDSTYGKLTNAEVRYDSLMSDLAKRYPNYQRPSSLINETLRQTQSGLSGNQSFISYYAGDTTLYFLAANSHSARLTSVRGYEKIGERVTAILEDAKTPTSDVSMLKTNLANLYNQLIKPVEDVISDSKRLLILPDGYLGYLPFDLLLTDKVPATNFSEWPFLLKKYAVGYDFSIRLHLESEKVRSGATDQPYLGFAPSYKQENVKDLLVYEGDRAEDIAIRKFGQLSYNQQEVTAAQALFGGAVYVDSSATEESFRSHAGKTGLLHLSMHAFFDEAMPDQSGLLFYDYQPESIIENTDGFLRMSDLYTMHLDAELVLLSACETGYGYLERGEGVASIGRAFKYAGIPTVAMSLWYANDRSTSHIMKVFTQGLEDGMTKDEALRQAKLAYLKSADVNTAHPYYWSAFVVNGSMEPLTFLDRNNYYWWWVGGAVLFLIALVVLKSTMRKS